MAPPSLRLLRSQDLAGSSSASVDARARADRERALRSALADGDRDAFAQLVAPHLDALYTVCLRMTRDTAVAEDLAQETLVRVLRQAHRYDPERAFRPWLLKIGLNLCRDKLRTVWWRRVLPLQVPGEDHRVPRELVGSRRSGPEARSSEAQRDRLVRNALATLPPMYREAVTLFHLEDMTYAEMAEITDVNVPALKQRVRRGCVMLKEAVVRMYPELVPDRT